MIYYSSSDEERSICREMGIHGQRWGSLFGGYFSDPEASRPLIEAVERAIVSTHPSVVADLGGGTGFLLQELLRRGLQGIHLVNVDLSPKQLSAIRDFRIIPLQVSLDKITRSQLQAENVNLLLVARSVLHYFGRFGLEPLLRHLRSQLRPGELFVHQSACSELQKNSDLINRIFCDDMGTQKWYCTVKDMIANLEKAGFRVHETIPAPRLCVGSGELAERYGLSHQQIIFIRDDIIRLYGQDSEIFICSDDGFKLWWDSFIFTCEAV